MKQFSSLIGIVLIILIMSACGNKPSYSDILETQPSDPPDHQAFTALLSSYVNDEGWVNYQGFMKDSSAFNTYLQTLSDNVPAENWSRNEQLAYWINVYNAFTIEVILDHYPLGSITDIKTFHIPLVNTIWQDEIIPISNQMLSLDYVEHQILRKVFEEPRIHFVIVCASVSCPKLRQEAYVAKRLDAQLEEQAGAFINDPSRNELSKDGASLSKIFSWFEKDFTKDGSLLEYINQFAKKKVDPNATVDYLPYDWGLNEQK